MIGKSIAHFDILDRLGGGGMGIVYRARDTKLDRLVALKFLPPELSFDKGAKRRFRQEARAASALNHPNICAIHDIGESESGELYIVMPLYEGQTLKHRINSDSEGTSSDNQGLSEAKSVSIARQIAVGLDAAHAKGIIHRDIKPANLFITKDDRVIILDFGIAKLADGFDLTKTGSTVGTTYYMSPEQIRGEPAGKASDLWALGIVLYQMLCGRRPFDGEYEHALGYSILNEEPQPIEVNSPGLQAVLAALLCKDADRRPASADVVIKSLDALGKDQMEVASVTQPVHTVGQDRTDRPLRLWLAGAALLIAVVGTVVFTRSNNLGDYGAVTAVSAESKDAAIAILPFSNMRTDPETDFLGYALADQVIGSLAYVRSLRVRPASSVRRYQDGQYEIEQVASDLDVDYVVAGNYLKQNDVIRLTVELVDTSTEEIVWSEPFEITYEDVFVLQDSVSRRVIERLQVSFSDDERDRMRSDVSRNPLAYEFYLKAIAYPWTRDGSSLALDMLQQSLDLDSTFAPAWNHLGFRRHDLGMFGMVGGDMSRSGEAAFEKALQLNPQLQSALVDLSAFYTDAGDPDKAYELALRAIEINPSNALAHFARGYVLRYVGVLDESAKSMRTALDLDSTNTRLRSATPTFIALGRWDEAMHALSVDKGSPYYHSFLGVINLRRGNNEEAKLQFGEAARLDATGIMGPFSDSYHAYLREDYDAGVEAARVIESAGIVDGEADYGVASLYCMNKDVVGCLRNLRLAVDNGYFDYPWFQRDMLLDNARSHPEFDDILEEVRIRHERFKARHFPDVDGL